MKIDFTSKNSNKVYVLDTDTQAITDENGNAPVSPNNNGKILIQVKLNGLDENGTQVATKCWRIIFDEKDETQQSGRRSFSIKELTVEKVQAVATMLKIKNANILTIGKKPQSATGTKKTDEKRLTEYNDFDTLATAGITDAPTMVFDTIAKYNVRGERGQKLIDELNAQIDALTERKTDFEKRKADADKITDDDWDKLKASALKAYSEYATRFNDNLNARKAIDKLDYSKLDDDDLEKQIERLRAIQAQRAQAQAQAQAQADENADDDGTDGTDENND